MKLTESRIKEIILEEVEKAKQEQDEQEAAKTLQQLKDLLLNLSKQATKIKGASPKEVKAAAELILKLLKSLPKGEISTIITKTDQFFSQKTGNK